MTSIALLTPRHFGRAAALGLLLAMAEVSVSAADWVRGWNARGIDARELTIDTGVFLKFRRGPELILVLTEDLEPSGPAIDVTFRIGARW